jgi:hypothetical protein
MKKSYMVLSIALTLCVGFFAGRWSAARPVDYAVSKRPVTGDNNLVLDQLNELVSYLSESKQTNALKLFNEYSCASIAQGQSADMGVTLHTLMALHEGRTNDAMELLEITLNTEIVGFAASYKEVPEAHRQWIGLHALGEASWYRSKFPLKGRYQNVDDGVARAFELLEKHP